MIRSKDRWSTLSRSAGRWMFGAGAGALAFALVAPVTLAQQAQPKSTAAPKAAAAVPAAGQTVEDAWVKLCLKNKQTGGKRVCQVNSEQFDLNKGTVLIVATVQKADGEDKQQLIIRLTTAYALVMPVGVQIGIDGEKPVQLQYSVCFPTFCQVQMELPDELYKKMRSGKEMVVAAMNYQEKTIGFPVPLAGFSKAYDGPPVDIAKYDAQRRQVMENYRKRQAALAAKAKQGPPAAGAAGNATAQQKKAPAAQ